jgi:hypothetical protein
MSRNKYNKDHEIHLTGAIGHARTIDVLPVVAGESLEMRASGIIRLTQLRREIVRDAQVDICGFYRPHRHSYGDDWENFIKSGVDETVTFTGQSTSGATGNSLHGCFLLNDVPATIPQWLADGYLDIYNRYYKVPTDDDFGRNFNVTEYMDYGFPATKLPHPITTPIDYEASAPNRDLNSADYTVEIPVSGTADLDLRAFEQIQKRYKSELDKTWFSNRYSDVLETTFGSTVNIDADQRPEMLFRKTFMMSGMEVNGTDDATLGQYVGKTLLPLDFGFPRKNFDEHGSVWIIAVVRWPTIFANESHKLMRTVNPSYKEISGDPVVLSAEPPVELDASNYLTSGNVHTGYYEPYGNWYREQPSVVDPLFDQQPGYPWHQYIANVDPGNWYYDNDQHLKVFQTDRLKDWQIHCKCETNSYSPVPDPRASIYSGTK